MNGSVLERDEAPHTGLVLQHKRRLSARSRSRVHVNESLAAAPSVVSVSRSRIRVHVNESLAAAPSVVSVSRSRIRVHVNESLAAPSSIISVSEKPVDCIN